MNDYEVDKIYLLQQIKQHSKDKLRDKGIELYLSKCDEYDIKNLNQVVKENNFDKLSDLISGKGIEVDFEDEEKKGETVENNQSPILDKNKNKNFIQLTTKNLDNNEIKLIFQISFDEKGNVQIENVGEIQQENLVLSKEYEQQIRNKVEQTGVTQNVEPVVIEREFIPKTLEQLNEMNEEGKLDLEDEKEIKKRAIKEQNKENNFEESEKEENSKDEFTEELSEEEKSIAEMACEKTRRDMKKIKRALTIRDPKSATETLENDELDDYGQPITVLEFSGVAGKEEYTLVQGQRILDERYFDEDINKLMMPFTKTEGEIERVSDEETKVAVRTSDGKEEDVKVQSMPSDITQEQKKEMIFELEKIMDEIKKYEDMDPNEFETPEDREKIINGLEEKLNDVFKKYGVIPPENIREDADDRIRVRDNDGGIPPNLKNY